MGFGVVASKNRNNKKYHCNSIIKFTAASKTEGYFRPGPPGRLSDEISGLSVFFLGSVFSPYQSLKFFSFPQHLITLAGMFIVSQVISHLTILSKHPSHPSPLRLFLLRWLRNWLRQYTNPYVTESLGVC
mgnify:CR=1 FL=1